MDIVLFLHFYQPPTQFPDVLENVIRESYDPVLTLLENNPQVKVTINMSASLTEQLSLKHWEILAKFRRLCERRQIELVGSAAYHPLLVKIPEAEISRQIKINEEINTRLWQVSSQRFKGTDSISVSRIRGFFPPEMAISAQVLKSVKSAGYSYILADESAIGSEKARLLGMGRIFIDKATGLKVIVRHKEVSLDVAFSKIQTTADLLSKASRLYGNNYLILAMDGETFGHHQPEQLNFLSSLFSSAVASDGSSGLSLISISELLARSSSSQPVSIQESSWGESFDRWDSLTNPIHKYQWEMLNLAIETVSLYSERDESYWQARNLLDKGLHSDQFWWASYKPCWHYKMVQRGALLLLTSVSILRDESSEIKSKKALAEDLYHKLTSTSLEMYGDTVIAC
mgnify:CR=1 FL=1